MKKTLLSACSLIALAALVPSSGARAEMMDYASLQDLFGEAVTTAATGTPQKASDVATNMTIITQDMIRRAGTRDLPRIIGMYVSGIDVMQSGKQGYDVGVRGYQQPTQPRLLVLLDGRQVFVDDYSRTIWTSIPVNPDDIRQIEVVKGASSALFGSNAAGGVVNIITKNPLFDTSNVASVSIGSNGYASGDASATTKIGSLGGVKISAGGMQADEFRTLRNAMEEAIKEDPKRRYVVGSGAFQLTQNIQANVEGTYSHTKDTEANFTSALFGQETKNISFRAGGSWQSPFGVWTNNNYINRHDIAAMPANFPVRLGLVTDLIVSQLENQFKIGADHTFRLAFEYRNKKFNVDNADPSFNTQNPEITENNYAGGVTWLWNLTNKLAFTNAVRLDHLDMKQTGTIGATSTVMGITESDYSHSINELSANSGIVYKATDVDTFRLTYGRGVQMPSLIQTGMSMTVPTYIAGVFIDMQGAPDLQPSIIQNYELGYDRDIARINSKARVSFFYQLNQNALSYNQENVIWVFNGNVLARSGILNVGRSRGWGGEVELKGSNAAGFRWQGLYSYARVAEDTMSKAALRYTSSAPEHRVQLNGGYTTGKWEMDVNSLFATSTLMNRYNNGTNIWASTNGYMAVGGRVGYNITDNFVVALSGMNLTRDETQTNPFPAVERQTMLTFTGKF